MATAEIAKSAVVRGAGPPVFAGDHEAEAIREGDSGGVLFGLNDLLFRRFNDLDSVVRTDLGGQSVYFLKDGEKDRYGDAVSRRQSQNAKIGALIVDDDIGVQK